MRYYDGLARDYDLRFNNPRLNYMRSVEKKVLLDMLAQYVGSNSILRNSIELADSQLHRSCEHSNRVLPTQHNYPGLILDIGCGTGDQSLFLAKKGYFVLGLDISKEMIKKAGDRMKEAGLKDRVSFILASAEALPLRDKSVDGLVSIFGVYSHVQKASQAFQEIHRVLKEGSRGILTVVNRWNLAWWIKTFLRGKVSWLIFAMRNKEYTVDGLWTYYFSKSELKKTLGKIGFKVRIGSILLLIYPHDRGRLLFHEKLFALFEAPIRWSSPFNGLGYYLLAVLAKP